MSLIIIIGGSSGIGKSTLDILSKDNIVVNMSRTKVNGINNIYMDVEDYKCVDNAFEQLKKEYGVPDIMIYSAGFVEPQGLLEITPEIWNKTINVNLNGAFYCTQNFIRIKKDDAKIIYISSTAGTRAQAGWSAYASAKAGLINFALTMFEELKTHNIKVYCLAPGRCATPLRKILAPNEDQSKIMQPESVGSFIKYIIEDTNDILCNQVIIVKKQ